MVTVRGNVESLSFLMESHLLKATRVAPSLARVPPVCLLKVLGNNLKFLVNHLTLTSWTNR